MANTVMAKFTHREVTIQLMQDGRFYFPGHGSEVGVKDSLQEARECIERVEAAKEKTERVKLNLSCFFFQRDSKNTVQIVVTGVHAGHGRITTSPIVSDPYDDSVYPDTEASRKAAAEMFAAKAAYAKAKNRLDQFAIPTRPGSYKCPHEEAVSALQSRYAIVSKLK